MSGFKFIDYVGLFLIFLTHLLIEGNNLISIFVVPRMISTGTITTTSSFASTFTNTFTRRKISGIFNHLIIINKTI